MLACARQPAAASLAAAARPRTSACVCCGSGPHLGESRNLAVLLVPVSSSGALKMKSEWMFHSKQLALDAAVLLTEVESCALSPSTAFVLQASFATPSELLHTYAAHVCVWTWQLVFCSS